MYKSFLLRFFPAFVFPSSLLAQTVKNLPPMQDTWIWSLGWEDPLEKKMAIYSSILVCRIPWTEEPGGLQSIGSERVGHDWATNTASSHGQATSLSSLNSVNSSIDWKSSCICSELPVPSNSDFTLIRGLWECEVLVFEPESVLAC